MTDIVLETLRNGKFRVTVRIDGRTVAWKDGTDARQLIDSMMAEHCSHHRRPDGYDMKHITLNDAAKSYTESEQSPYAKAYAALKEIAKDDLPTLKHLITVKQSYESGKNFDKTAQLSLQMLLIKLADVNMDAAILLGTPNWEPNITAWVQMLDSLGPEGLGAFIGLTDPSQIPEGPAPESKYQKLEPMQIKDIIKSAESNKSVSALTSALCEDMNFKPGQKVYVAGSIGQSSMRGEWIGLSNGFAIVKDLRGVKQTVLPHMVFSL